MADEPNKPNRPIRPRGGPSGRKRRVVIDGGNQRGRDGRQARDRGATASVQPRQQPVVTPTGPVTVPSGVSVKDLSAALGITVAQIIKIMMGLGEMVTITQSLSDESVVLIAAEVDREVVIKHAADDDSEPEVFEDSDDDLAARPPVVTIMGHVDHGKTTLLDAIRQTAVVDTEAGGITQHIGAYQAVINGRKITFLDTPGHEAFTAMRARGAKVTDIAILVVAADDGVMPQTRESISHARAAEVPIVVAVNKIDVPNANLDRVRSELASEGLQPEEWGGTTQFAEVSAKQKLGLDELLEKLLLVADAELDLRANPSADASGPIIESRLDVGRGPVATMLVHRGTLRVGDAIVAGDASGKVRALYDYKGEKVKEARPGEPVEILGFDRPPRQESWRGSSSTSVRPRIWRRSGPSGSAESSWPSARSAASRSRACSPSCRRVLSRISTSSSRATCRAPSRRSSASSARSSTPRYASTSFTPASAGSPRTTSTWRRPRTRS